MFKANCDIWRNSMRSFYQLFEERKYFLKSENSRGLDIFCTSSFASLVRWTPQNDVDLFLRTAHTNCSRYWKDCPQIKVRLSTAKNKTKRKPKWLNIEQNEDKTIWERSLWLLLIWLRCLLFVSQCFFIWSLILLNPLLFKENCDIGKYHIKSLINL